MAPPLLLLLAVAGSLRATVVDGDNGDGGGDQIIRPLKMSCSTGDGSSYVAGGQYHKNLDQLLAAIPMAAAGAENHGFYNGSFGAAPDEVFGLVMCYAQATGDADPCRKCLAAAPSGIMQLCPGSRTARAVFDECVVLDLLGRVFLLRRRRPHRWVLREERVLRDEALSKTKRRRRLVAAVVVGLSAGGVVLVLCMSLSVRYFLHRRRQWRTAAAVKKSELEQPLKQNELSKGTGPRRLRVRVPWGVVHHERPPSRGEEDVQESSKQGWKEFVSEVRIISRLRHRNLVQLIGWCHDGGDELLLVYELMPNGSLDGHIYGPENIVLPWPVRYEVLLGVGSALLYLHEETTEQCVLHRDIKPSNVMLDASFDAKLGDFGLARLVDGEFDGQEMECVLAVGLWCAHPDRALRPSVRQAVGVVRFEAPLPALPARMPVATYTTPPAAAGSADGSGGDDDTNGSTLEMQRLVVVLLLFSLLAHEATAVAAQGQGCSRRCGGLVVPYPFGFSGSCPIMLSCNVDAGNSTAALILQPHRPRRQARWLSGANYGVSSRTGLFLRGCRNATTANCSVPVETMLHTTRCGGGGGNETASSSLTCIASISPATETERGLGGGLFAQWEKVEEPSCENLLTSVYGDTREGVFSLEFAAAEMGWWLNGSSGGGVDEAGRCAANATCIPVQTPSGNWGHRCECLPWMAGDGVLSLLSRSIVSSSSVSNAVKHRRIPEIAVATAGSVAFLICLALTVWCLLRRRQWRWNAKLAVKMAPKHLSKDARFFRGKPIEDELELEAAGPRRFHYDELAAATASFSDDRRLGSGGFGSVYRGFLNGGDVAVKRVAETSRQGWKEFVAEVRIISRLRHRNLVPLIGWCHDGGDELLLVYELMPNGSLDAHIHSPENVLPWPVRYEVVLGVGAALMYLHHEAEQRVVHRDIKPSNRQLLLHVILFSLLLPEASAAAAAAQGCSRRCGGLVVPYPFGFSGSCPIMLSCNVDAGNSTAALILQGNHSPTTDRSYTVVDGSFNSTTSTFAVSVPPSCNRTVPDAKRWLSGASYGVSSRVGMFLRGSCRTATTTACSVPADAMSKVIRAAQCGGAGGNGTASSSLTCVASIPPNSTAEALGVGLFARWDAVEEPRCDNMLTSFFYGETPEGVFALELAVAELGWWVNGSCNNRGAAGDLAAGRCAANAACNDVKTASGAWGHQCKCPAGFTGDGFAAGNGCYAGKVARSSKSKVVAVAVAVGSVAFLLFLTVVAWGLLRRRRRRRNAKLAVKMARKQDAGFFRGKPRSPDPGELAAATANFSDDTKLGSGGFGSVYRGILSDGGVSRDVAVKRVADSGEPRTKITGGP
uniref:Protein kinase domain-containing protein n=1 Tax=Oryza barthii TaxID=65489 RepID=A0A0D3HWL3_9ORYZ